VKNNPLTKQKISNSMKRAHTEGRAYTIGLLDRKKNIFSRPERWCNDVLANNNVLNVKHEVRIGKYFIDFLIDKYICLEMDGEQHARYPQKLRDMEKDYFLKENGYSVGRVSWKDCFNNSKYMIDIILNFVKTKNNNSINHEYTIYNQNEFKNTLYTFTNNNELGYYDIDKTSIIKGYTFSE
jgi:very-short-patch-repair endonuclease